MPWEYVKRSKTQYERVLNVTISINIKTIKCALEWLNTGEIIVDWQFIPEFYDTLAEEILADITR